MACADTQPIPIHNLLNIDKLVNDMEMSKIENKKFISELWDHRDEILPMTCSQYRINVMLMINNVPTKCLLDTGAQTNIITFDEVKRCNIMQFVDNKSSMPMKGIGGIQQTYGYIPYIEATINNIPIGMDFEVVNKSIGFNVILGLPILINVTIDM